MRKSSCAIAAVFLILTGPLFPQPALPPLPAGLVEKAGALYGIPAAQQEELRARGEISRFQGRDHGPLLLPVPGIARAIQGEMKDLDILVLVEALFIVPVSPEEAAREDFSLRIYNTLRSVSAMKGIEYWSASRERMRVMFQDSFVVKDEKSRSPLPDPLVTEIPGDDSIFIFQHDSSFGKNVYQARYRSQDGSVRLSMRNLTTMYYGILPLVKPEKLRLEIALLPGDDHILFYGCIGVDAFSMFGMEKKTQSSFYNRIKALYTWFAEKF